MEKQNIPIAKSWLDKNELLEVKKVLEIGTLTRWDKNLELEKLISDYLGVKESLCMSSCSDALYMALLSIVHKEYKDLDGEVLISDYTLLTIPDLVKRIPGLVPIFVDVDPKTYNMDYKDLKSKINKKKTKAIIVSHTFGQSANMDKIMHFANKKNIPVIEYGFLGSKFKGSYCGTMGTIGCFSLESGGGVLVTNEGNEVLNFIRIHGFIYNNYSMNDLTAAVEIAQFKKLDKIIKKKNSLARYYNKRLKELDFILAPYIRKGRGNVHTYNSYNCLTSPVTDRNKVWQVLWDNGIKCGIGGCAYHQYDSSKEIVNRSITLPLFYKLKKSEIDYIIDVLKENRDKIFI